MARHNEIGKWGEKLAEDYLVAQGHAIVARNERCGGVEIDIIAERGTSIMFVEVKTRTEPFRDPIEAVDMKKRSRLAIAADSYIRRYGIRHRPQFDIITVVGTPDNYTVNHYPDAFIPPLRTVR